MGAIRRRIARCPDRPSGHGELLPYRGDLISSPMTSLRYGQKPPDPRRASSGPCVKRLRAAQRVLRGSVVPGGAHVRWCRLVEAWACLPTRPPPLPQPGSARSLVRAMARAAAPTSGGRQARSFAFVAGGWLAMLAAVVLVGLDGPTAASIAALVVVLAPARNQRAGTCWCAGGCCADDPPADPCRPRRAFPSLPRVLARRLPPVVVLVAAILLAHVAW